MVEHRGVRRYATPYGELAELAGRFAAELERRGVGPGERVVLWGENSAEWVGVFFGCLLRGVIVVPLDAAGDAGFAARVVEDVGARLVVGDGGLLAGLALSVVRSPLSDAGEAAAGVGNEERSTKNVERLELRGIGGRLPKEAVWAVSEAVGPDTPFQIVFTSGTTREPRGVVHTHRNVLVTLEPIEREMAKYRRWERLVHPLRFLHSLPLSHVFGQFMGLWCPALLGAEVHFADQLEPGRMVELIRRERVSVLVAVPRVLELLRGYLVGRFGGSSQLSVGGSGEGQGRMRGLSAPAAKAPPPVEMTVLCGVGAPVEMRVLRKGKDKCGGLSTPRTPAPVEMTVLCGVGAQVEMRVLCGVGECGWRCGSGGGGGGCTGRWGGSSGR